MAGGSPFCHLARYKNRLPKKYDRARRDAVVDACVASQWQDGDAAHERGSPGQLIARRALATPGSSRLDPIKKRPLERTSIGWSSLSRLV